MHRIKFSSTTVAVCVIAATLGCTSQSTTAPYRPTVTKTASDSQVEKAEASLERTYHENYESPWPVAPPVVLDAHRESELAPVDFTSRGTKGKTIKASLLEVINKGAKARIKREIDGKEFTIPLSRLDTRTRQWIKSNKHRLEEPQFVGKFWWNCPAPHQREWFVCKTVFQQGNVTIVHEYSTGHTTVEDFTEVVKLIRNGNRAKRLDGSSYGIFGFTSAGTLETAAGFHYATPQEAKEKTDQEVARHEQVIQRQAEIRRRNALSHWLNADSNIRHNVGCRYYGTGNGMRCRFDDGQPCGICGG